MINVATYFETSFKVHKIHLIRHKANHTAHKFVHVHTNMIMDTRIHAYVILYILL